MVQGVTEPSATRQARSPMKLYQAFWSPFPTRVRLVLYFKGIDVELVEPPGFTDNTMSKGEYLRLNPLGRVPTLVLDDGTALPESEVICEYLEDAFPEPSMRPSDPVDLARMRLISRLSDVYVVMAMVPLFTYSSQRRSDRDRVKVERAVGDVATALGYIEHYIGEDGYAIGTALTHADGTLLPILQLASEWAPQVFGTKDPLPTLPKLSAYWDAIRQDPLAAHVLGETRDAVIALMGKT